jgi:phosphomannomutase
MDPEAGLRAVERLRVEPPSEVGGRRVLAVEDYPEASLLRLWVEGHGGSDRVRLQVRPSGTEPKVKIYGEAVGESAEVLRELVHALSSLL